MTLIGDRRISETVTDDPPPRLERRADRPGDVVAARGEEQQRLADRVPALGLAFEQQAADRLGSGRAARFARRQRVDPGASERLDKAPNLGRFPGPLPALDGNEFARGDVMRGGQ